MKDIDLLVLEIQHQYLKERKNEISQKMSQEDKEDFKAMIEDFVDELGHEQS